MERKASEALGVTFNGDVTFQGPMFDIHDNQHVEIVNRDLKREEMDDERVVEVKRQTLTLPEREEEMFRFIHPKVLPAQAWDIHDEVKRLVASHGIQEICSYLHRMARENTILLPLSISAAYNELVRMGMPNGGGFNEKTFQKYYRK